ncbi:MAG TPA: hypothetical protein VGD61_20730 [Pyrinomonadaceae bacterium]
MIRRLLVCSLMLFCLFAFGCSWFGGSESDNQQKAKDDTTAYSKRLVRDRDDVRDSLKAAKAVINKVEAGTNQSETSPNAAGRSTSPPKPSATKEPAKPEFNPDKVTEALNQLEPSGKWLDELDAALRHVPGSEKSLSIIEQVRTARKNAINNLSAVANALRDEDRDKVDSVALSKRLKDTTSEIDSALTQLPQINIPLDLEAPPSGIWQAIFDWAPTVGIVLVAIIGLVLLVFVIKTLLKLSAGRTEARIASRLKPLASNVQKQHEDFAAQLAKLTSSQNDLLTRINDFEFELKRVSRIARDAANDGMRGRSLASEMPISFREPVEKVEPLFPISTGDYLNKMQRSSNIVRPDFQNDILVSDPGGTGELVLIRDTTIPDDLQPLFVIPRYTQFQTKQDFYTYYQKYYECDRPTAGDVWIIDPAVVSRVSGGWQLREKGVLEVR